MKTYLTRDVVQTQLCFFFNIVAWIWCKNATGETIDIACFPGLSAKARPPINRCSVKSNGMNCPEFVFQPMSHEQSSAADRRATTDRRGFLTRAAWACGLGWGVFRSSTAQADTMDGSMELNAPEGSIGGDASVVFQDAATVCGERQDSLWLVSTRHLGGCPGLLAPSALQYQHCLAGQWCTGSFDEYVGDCATQLPAVFYIHGNRSDDCAAYQDGLAVYRSLTKVWCSNRPFRFVIWAWPSDKVCGLYRDVRVKAARTENQSWLLAEFLRQSECFGPRTLIGYSYGARVIAGALHLLAGGAFGGGGISAAADAGHLHGSPYVISPLNAVMWAGALPNRWLLPGHHYGRAIPAVNHLRIMVNHRDPVLRRYRRAVHEYDGQALGYAGIPLSRQLGSLRQRISLCDVTHAIGNRHDWRRYVESHSVMQLTRQTILM
jgi:hypothetical protein